MSAPSRPWPPGTPCWVDLNVADVGPAQAFYSQVLGWNFQVPDSDRGGYVTAQAGSDAVAGIGPQPPGSETAWTLYFASDDADVTARAVSDHGGQVVLAPDDVGSLGRRCIAADPTGGSFGIWQAGSHAGFGAGNAPGGLVWTDLRSPDPDAARRFYQELFGFETAPQPGAGGSSTTISRPGEERPLGGIGPRSDGAPTRWDVYFSVVATDLAVGDAERAGGSIVTPAFDTPYGRTAEVADPWGGRFWVVQPPVPASTGAGATP